MKYPIARIEPLEGVRCACAWKRSPRRLARARCTRMAGWRCIVRPIGRTTDKPARRLCTEHARQWANHYGIQMPLVAEVQLKKPHWSEVRDGQ